MSINSIEVRIHLDYKFNLRLRNFIINSSILNISLRYLEISISNLLWIVVWRHQATPTYSVQRYAACREVVSYGRRKSIFGKKIALRVRGLHARGITLSSFQRCHWKANIPQACQPVMLSKISNRFGEIAAGSRKSLPLIKPKWRFLGKKTPYGQIFTNLFQSPNRGHGNTSFVQILWNLADRKSVKSRVI